MLVEAVRAGELTEARLDESVRRIMAQKFALGLFENPYVDADAAARDGRARTRSAPRGSTRSGASLVLLENEGGAAAAQGDRRERRAARLRARYRHRRRRGARAGPSSTDPAQADVAIVRLDAPFETLHPGYVFGAMQHEGSLALPRGRRGITTRSSA